MSIDGHHRRSWLTLLLFIGVLGSLLLWGADVAAPTTGSEPSKHCHVSDGTFTTCTDGSKEWSDVPVTAFPDSHSFLYADQADLNPSLSSPNNTFVLMYDECGRTAPLGPNEYVLVNFKTVETENGGEKLNNYSVHLFIDGTLIFIENGFLKPPGRAKVVEGMQGAVGFGPSPNCSFNHVTAEFQIELSAAGGNSYSPDPLFWSSLTSPPPPPPPPSGPKILQPFFTPTPAWGVPYKLVVPVQETSSTPANVDVTVTERETDSATLGLGDSVIPLSQDSLLLPPGGFVNFEFPDRFGIKSYQHSWQWLGNIGPVCPDKVSDLLRSSAIQAIIKASSFLDKFDAATDILLYLGQVGLITRSNEYNYQIKATDSSLATDSANTSATVGVPLIRGRQLLLLLDLGCLQRLKQFSA